MDTDTLQRTQDIVNWIIVIDDTTDLTGIPDGIYPFADLTDQWVVIINEQAVNWAETWGDAFGQYAEALRVKREHAQHCPLDIPFDDDELIFASAADLWPDDYSLDAVRL